MIPDFSALGVPLWLYTAAGVVILWGKLNSSQRSTYSLTRIIALIIPEEHKKLREVFELLCYVSLGCLVAWGIVQPSTPAQALAAGAGWISLLQK